MKTLTAGAKAELDWSGLISGEVSGYAALYSYEQSINLNLLLFNIELSQEYYYGSVSAGIEWDFAEGKLAIAPPMVGVGYKFGVDLDW